ncbi:EF-P 5-aminopentanol modification-associated protein YfmH [Streptococcus caprae]|uniref:EF-P 5-aminopentanol modification-associated protein YfmH n=1 Tax=Streptococcus caprae TaxID=1640501 RepID=A0ABV8CVH2_9STRE
MRNLKKKVYPFIGEEVYFTVLDNGMKVYLLPKPEFQETSAMLTVDFGSIDNILTVDGKHIEYPKGLAHFLEHQLFEREDSIDVAQLFTKHGADSNAYTSYEKTSYFFSTIDHLEDSLTLLQNFVVNPKFTEMSIEKEKGIIIQEIEMYQDDPDFQLYSGLLRSLYPNTPLSEDIAGDEQSVNQTTLLHLQDMVNFFYNPVNFSLLLVGPFDVRKMHHFLMQNQVIAETEPSFHVMKHHLNLEPVQISKSMRMDVSMAKLAVGFRGPLPKEGEVLRQKIALRLLFSMLFGWTSQIYQEWYDSGKINDSFDIEVEVSPRFKFVALLFDTNQPISMVNQIKQYLKNFSTSPDLNEVHLLEIKKEFYGEFIRSLDSIDNLANQFVAYSTEGQTYYDIPEILQELTLSEIIQMGNDFFQQSDMSDFTIFPR